MRGYATNFADPGDLARYHRAKALGKSESYALSIGDNGVGAPVLGGVTTPESYGVAVPRSYLRQQFGNDPEAWRRARAQVTYGDKTVQVPIVDIGPGSKQQRRGVITDLTYPLSQDLGTGGKSKVDLQIVGDAGPDYKADPEGWQDEQNQIANNLNPSAYGQSMAAMPASSDTGMYAGPDLDQAIRGAQIADQLAYT
jgi:hypothetical protein